MPQPRRVVERRVELLAGTLQQDRARLLVWAFFDCVLGACWSIEDNSDWQYHMTCAQIFDPLVT